MSRIGKHPINVPENVVVTIEGNSIIIKGPKGELSRVLDSEVTVKQEGGQIFVEKKYDNKVSRQKWGLSRSLVNNMVVGVTEGFKKILKIEGVGYRAIVQNQFLSLSLGYSHDIKYFIPENLEIKCPKATVVELFSYDKEALGQVAAELRSLRLPEPYKGKGVKYDDEYIFRKEGKK